MTDKTDKKGIDTSFERLPNKEAERHFNQKSLITSAEFANFKAYQHALAFTVAGLADKDMLTEVHKAVKSAIDNGTSFHDFKKTLKPFLVAKGWLAPELTDDKTVNKELLKDYEKTLNRRLKTIYHTNKQTAYAAGKWERIQKTKDFLPYLQYLPSASVNKRDGHKAYYDIIRPVDDPIWQSIFPPNGFGCKCSVKQISKSKALELGITDDDKIEKLPVPDFDSSFDRLGSLLRLAEDKHGVEFAEKLSKGALDDLLAGLAQGLSTNDFMRIMNATPFNQRSKSLFHNNQTISKQAEQFGLSPEELFSIMAYTDSHGFIQKFLRDFGGFMRTRKSFVSMIAKQILYMMSGLRKLPDYIGKVVRRVDFYDDLQNLQIGAIITEKAFVSGSVMGIHPKNDAFNTRKVRLIIESKTGKQIDWLAYYPSQREVIFLPNTNFQVTRIQRVESELWIELTEIL